MKNYYSNLSLAFCVTLKDYYQMKRKPFPLFLKKNVGSGNKDCLIIKDKSEIKKITNKNFIVQEYLNQDYDEFTCGIYRSNNYTGSIIFQRKLHHFGFTYHAKVCENKKISKILESIANRINLNGCLNIQFKKKGNKIKIFDINTRLSSTVFFRDMVGFKDLLWWIKDKLKKKHTPKFNVKNVRNKTIVKYFEDKMV